MEKAYRQRFVIAATGASGMPYFTRLLEHLAIRNCEISCIISDAARKVFEREENGDIENAVDVIRARKDTVAHIKIFGEDDFDAPCASGSYAFDAMAIIPCSMKTLGKIANSIADNLIARTADVALKERRRLVIVARETPLALTHLRNMTSLSEAGAIILPACPAFYNKPKTLDDIVDFIAARTISAMGLKQDIIKEWNND